MIFRNTIRLIVSNFSNVWKLILYYLICFALTALTCGYMLAPIITKLAEANVFTNIMEVIRGFFASTPVDSANQIDSIAKTVWHVLESNVQFKFNYVFLITWLCFIFPFLLELAQLAIGDTLYGYMTSHVKYGFTGRFVKNIKKSALYSLLHTLICFVLNALMIAFMYLIIYVATIGNVWFLVLDAVLIGLFLCFSAFKRTLLCCWMPDIAVLDENVFKAFVHNFKATKNKFAKIYSNTLLMSITAWVVNVLFAVMTMGVSLIITIPLSSFAFIVLQMVSFFTTHGMRYYVYPDMFVSPKTFEEQDNISKVKYIL